MAVLKFRGEQMTYTEQLLKLPVSTELKGCLIGGDGKPLAKGDLLKEVSREAYNCTRKAIVVNSDAELKKAIKIGLSCRAGGTSNETINDLIENAHIVFKNKVAGILEVSATGIGEFVPKFSNPNVSDAPVFFKEQKGLTSGVTSASCNYSVTGSGNGANITGYSFLSSTYILNNVEKNILIDELAGTIISDRVHAATSISLEREMCATVDQFYKQSITEFDGELIACTPLLSASMAVEMKRSIDDVFANDGRISYSKFAVGGTNSQNVAALNADLGGGTHHVTAWIPRAVSVTPIYNVIGRLNNFSLSGSIRHECSILASLLEKTESKGNSNISDRAKIDRVFSRAASVFLYMVKELCGDLAYMDDEKRMKAILSINDKWVDYINSSSKQDVADRSVNIAFSIAESVKREISRNAFSVHVEPSAIKEMCKVLENKGGLCL